jgi:hypothetical protein
MGSREERKAADIARRTKAANKGGNNDDHNKVL